jgi:TonB family protein
MMRPLLLVLVLAMPAVAGAQDAAMNLRNWAASGQVEPIRKMLSTNRSSDVDAPDEAGWTALMHAASAGHEAVVRVLLDAGADIRRRDKVGETALHLAAANGRTAVSRLLLQAGADFAARDVEGRTPLFSAIESGRGEIIALLHSAAVSTSKGQSPALAVAAEGNTVAPLLVQWLDPPYTEEASNQGIEGTVVLTVLVRADGSVGAASVKRSLEKTLDDSALQAVKRWRFEPATRSGNPVAVVVELSVAFAPPTR